ncbi:MAG: sugar ABC transporter permease [Lachnospiraceae bacterium]|nr:sugar ABC transporter permease [Lachnospiraceae bacterium]
MGKNKNRLERHYTKWGYIFSIPFVVIFLIFSFWPMASTVYYAFCYLKHAGNTNPQFLPLIGEPWYKNFAEIFKSQSFLDALKNTFAFWIAQTIPEWILAFWLAVMMTDRRLKIKGRFLFRTSFFFPKLVAGTTLGGSLLIHLISVVGEGVGITITASMIDGFGLTYKDLEFFTSVQFFIIVVSLFMHFGIVFIYAVAGITGIPVEIFEAAEMDGASRSQTFFRITLPCMRPMLFFITVITVVDGLGMVDIPSYFGAYDTFRRNLTLMMYMENQAFLGSYAYDRASAASLILLLIYIAISVLLYFTLIRDKDEARQKKLRKKALKALENNA